MSTLTVFESLKSMGIVPGSVVVSTAGRDRDRTYLVIEVREKIALVCDGRVRDIENPKKKRVSHIRSLGVIKDLENQIGVLGSDIKSEGKNILIRKLLAEHIEELKR